MKSKKLSKKDKAWQEAIEKQVKKENVPLGNPKGKELFDKVLKNAQRHNS
jgi:hypothetical protein